MGCGVRGVRKRNVGGGRGGRRAWGEERIEFERQQASQRKETQGKKLEMKRQRGDLGNYSPNFLRVNLRRSASTADSQAGSIMAEMGLEMDCSSRN